MGEYSEDEAAAQLRSATDGGVRGGAARARITWRNTGCNARANGKTGKIRDRIIPAAGAFGPASRRVNTLRRL